MRPLYRVQKIEDWAGHITYQALGLAPAEVRQLILERAYFLKLLDLSGIDIALQQAKFQTYMAKLEDLHNRFEAVVSPMPLRQQAASYAARNVVEDASRINPPDKELPGHRDFFLPERPKASAS